MPWWRWTCWAATHCRPSPTPCATTAWQPWRARPEVGKVQGSRFKVQGSRFKVQGSRFKVQGSRRESRRVAGLWQLPCRVFIVFISVHRPFHRHNAARTFPLFAPFTPCPSAPARNGRRRQSRK
ncbi:MAG: hypothetical protein C0613_11690 [Desulfobulbaceae bacterium]|nr:MAG: hypothetical protein C0613_11690 [Desulfobulbaceae bacterium]